MPIIITPALNGENPPQVICAPFKIRLSNIGKVELCFHTQKLKSYIVRMISSKNGLTSNAIGGLKLLAYCQIVVTN